MFFCYTLTLGGEVMNHILLCYFCRLCVILAKIFGSIAVAIAVVYGVDYARKVLLPFVWKKKDLGDKVHRMVAQTAKIPTSVISRTFWQEKSQGEELRNELISQNTLVICV